VTAAQAPAAGAGTARGRLDAARVALIAADGYLGAAGGDQAAAEVFALRKIDQALGELNACRYALAGRLQARRAQAARARRQLQAAGGAG
jgi:hypothetical protein